MQERSKQGGIYSRRGEQGHFVSALRRKLLAGLRLRSKCMGAVGGRGYLRPGTASPRFKTKDAKLQQAQKHTQDK